MIAHAWIFDDPVDGEGGWKVTISQDDLSANRQGTVTLTADELSKLYWEYRERTDEPCGCGSRSFFPYTIECRGCGKHCSG